MANFRPHPVAPEDILLDENGHWWHPEIEVIQAQVGKHLEEELHKYDQGTILPPEFNEWVLIELKDDGDVLCSWWVREYLLDASTLSLKPRQPRLG